MSAPRETLLTRYAQLVRKWNPAINLVASSTLDDFEHRHLADAVQLARVAEGTQGTWLDLGSGGGLPGIVVAIFAPERPVTLVDSDSRKVAFLKTAIRDIGLQHCTATAGRIETLEPAHADHVSARALAPLERLMPYLERHLAQDGTAWLMKGQSWQSEVETIARAWRFDLTPHPSETRPGAAILEIRNLTRA